MLVVLKALEERCGQEEAGVYIVSMGYECLGGVLYRTVGPMGSVGTDPDLYGRTCMPYTADASIRDHKESS